MPSHHVVNVVIAQRSRKHDYSSLNKALERIKRDPLTRVFRGDNFEYVGNSIPIAARLSRMKDVDRVVVTLVSVLRSWSHPVLVVPDSSGGKEPQGRDRGPRL